VQIRILEFHSQDWLLDWCYIVGWKIERMYGAMRYGPMRWQWLGGRESWSVGGLRTELCCDRLHRPRQHSASSKDRCACLARPKKFPAGIVALPLLPLPRASHLAIDPTFPLTTQPFWHAKSLGCRNAHGFPRSSKASRHRDD